VTDCPAELDATEFPLLARETDGVLFRTTEGIITAADFLGAAQAVAAALPNARCVVNLCQDRYRFTVGFAAAVLRGQTMLLVGDKSPERLRELAAEYPDLYALSDQPLRQSALPTCIVSGWKGELSGAVPWIAADQLAAIGFTSGTAGRPTAHRKPWGALVSRSIDAARRFVPQPGSTFGLVGMVPAQHMYGFETTVLLPLHAPVTSWSGAAFFPSDVEAALRLSAPPRVLVTTPLQIRALLNASVNLPELALVISATAPLSSELAAEAERQWNTEVFEIFGATEVGSIASRRTVADDIWTTYPRVSLTDNAVVMAPHAEPCALSDRIEIIDPSRFRLIGRKTDIIKLGGRRESLAALNRLLVGIDGVVDGMFLAPEDVDTRPNARLTALVVAPERSQEDLLAALRGKIDPVFLPRRIIRLESLPRNEIGKLPERAIAELRQRYRVQ
jgi:acyl-coenzyme A synthetase/AMP-(fatty) acid ligase